MIWVTQLTLTKSYVVIGAGLGRSGTTSLKSALEILDFGPCHHMSEAMKQNLPLVKLWKDVASGDEEALKQIFSGYKSTMDYPGCSHFEKFLEWNKDAKVVLSVRDSPEQWARSARNTIFSRSLMRRVILKLLFSFPLSKLYYLQYIQTSSFAKHEQNPLKPGCDLEQLYSDWIEHVTSKVPPGQLLIYNVKQGWGPLCAFLDVPVPGIPFPVSNDRGGYERNNHFRATRKWIIFFMFVVIMSAIIGVIIANTMRTVNHPSNTWDHGPN